MSHFRGPVRPAFFGRFNRVLIHHVKNDLTNKKYNRLHIFLLKKFHLYQPQQRSALFLFSISH